MTHTHTELLLQRRFTAQQKEARRERDTTCAPERPTHTRGQNTFHKTSTWGDGGSAIFHASRHTTTRGAHVRESQHWPASFSLSRGFCLHLLCLQVVQDVVDPDLLHLLWSALWGPADPLGPVTTSSLCECVFRGMRAVEWGWKSVCVCVCVCVRPWGGKAGERGSEKGGCKVGFP